MKMEWGYKGNVIETTQSLKGFLGFVEKKAFESSAQFILYDLPAKSSSARCGGSATGCGVGLCGR